MDPHPIIVHFPIALLSLYSIFELIRFRFVTNKPYWFYVKGVLVIFGTLGAYAAYITGPEGNGGALKQMHETFATVTVVIYTLIALIYLANWFIPSKFSNKLLKFYIIVPLALFGFAATTITGGLGGALVYGTHFDPLMAPIFKILGVY